MQLDNEQQRQMLLGIINACAFKGSEVEIVVELKRAIAAASVLIKEKKDGRASLHKHTANDVACDDVAAH